MGSARRFMAANIVIVTQAVHTTIAVVYRLASVIAVGQLKEEDATKYDQDTSICTWIISHMRQNMPIL